MKCKFSGNSSPCWTNGEEIWNFIKIRFIQTSSAALNLHTCSREAPYAIWAGLQKRVFRDILLFFHVAPDFQTRHVNRVSISHTLICDHFPPHSALYSLKSCNADLKLSQSILLHMALQPVKCGGSRWLERSVVFHNFCVKKVFCTKIINFFFSTYPHPQFWISHT